MSRYGRSKCQRCGTSFPRPFEQRKEFLDSESYINSLSTALPTILKLSTLCVTTSQWTSKKLCANMIVRTRKISTRTAAVRPQERRHLPRPQAPSAQSQTLRHQGAKPFYPPHFASETHASSSKDTVREPSNMTLRVQHEDARLDRRVVSRHAVGISEGCLAPRIGTSTR